MTAPKTPLLDELAGHEEQLATARARARALAEAIAKHAEAIEQLRADRIEAFAQDDERRAAALQKKAGDAEAKAGELAERRAGADLAATRAARGRDAFIAEHHGELVAERSPMAHAAVKAIEDATASLAAGVKAWRAEAASQLDLLRPVAGRDGREIPDLHIYQLVRDLGRAVQAGVPAPLPPQPSISRPAAPRAKAGQAADDGDSGFAFERIG